jgi:DHA1 family bicyclomycin/chloramphenicol resistance-like MFS transporter
MLAPSVGAAIMLITGWRGIFGAVGALTLILLVGTFYGLPESHRPVPDRPQTHPFRIYTSLLTHRQFVGYLIAAAANGASYFTYMALSPLILMTIYNLSPSQYALLMAVNGGALIAATQINRWLLRRISPRQILHRAGLSAALLILPIILFGFTLFGGLPVLIGLVCLVTMSGGFIQANSMAIALNAEPAHVGSAAALFGAAMFGSGTLASMAGGMLYDGTPRPLMFLMAIMLAIMALSLKILAQEMQ